MSVQENKMRKMALRNALRSRNPETVAAVLNLPPIDPKPQNQPSDPNFPEDSLVDDSRDPKTDWSAVLNALNVAHFYAKKGDIGLCFEAQSTLHSSLNHVFSVSAGNWLLPALHAVCVNTHRTAVMADVTLGLGRKDHTRLENAVTLLQESFSKTLNDRKPNEVR